MTGNSYQAYGEEFSSNDSEYADTTIIFDSRSDSEAGIPLCINPFGSLDMLSN